MKMLIDTSYYHKQIELNPVGKPWKTVENVLQSYPTKRARKLGFIYQHPPVIGEELLQGCVKK